jgi:hypothetical protein
MDPDHAADMRADMGRRAVLAALAGAAGTIAGMEPAQARDADARPGTAHMRAVQAEYRRLIALWQEERKSFAYSSNTNDYWSGPHGRAIVALGAAVIPQLINEVRKGDFFFNAPLAMITGIDIADGGARSEQAKSVLWLKWWDGAGAAGRP